MKRLLIGVCVLSVLGLSGCAGLKPKPASADETLNNGRMASGPGLFDGKYGSKDGLVVYSSNPKQRSLLGSGGKQRQEKPETAPASTSGSAASQAAPASGPSATAPQDYREFQAFQRFQHFKRLSKNSPEYQEFKQWQQWQRYKQWKAQQTKNQ